MSDPQQDTSPTTPTAGPAPTVEIEVDGRRLVCRSDQSLLDALRVDAGVSSVKDGCSPQGQCGCCTVLVDGQARVSCVTPVRRVAGKEITTLDGIDPERRAAWARAFDEAGASQCGFCTPGIICRFEAASLSGADHDDPTVAAKALRAHLCRCTGWQPIVEAWTEAGADLIRGGADPAAPPTVERDVEAAEQRALLEGGRPQQVGPHVALGGGGFAEDSAPTDSLVAVPDSAGRWVAADRLSDARRGSGKVQGRRTTAVTAAPIAPPAGEWALTLSTQWLEPAHLETDASWARPGGVAADPIANGGAFGAKEESPLPATARTLADQLGRPVRVCWSREDSVRHGPKRPPIGAGIAVDGSGTIRVARTPGLAERIQAINPRLTVEETDLPGPPTSASLRSAGTAEARILTAAVGGDELLSDDAGGTALVEIPEATSARLLAGAERPSDEPPLRVVVRAGSPLDRSVLSSYVCGAIHQGLGWVLSEGLAVDAAGNIHDLTIRSFGILTALAMPLIDIEVVEESGPAVPVSDLVVAAAALSIWRAADFPPAWPVRSP